LPLAVYLEVHRTMMSSALSTLLALGIFAHPQETATTKATRATEIDGEEGGRGRREEDREEEEAHSAEWYSNALGVLNKIGGQCRE